MKNSPSSKMLVQWLMLYMQVKEQIKMSFTKLELGTP